MSAPYQAFRCVDGYVTVGAANDRTFAKLASLLGHPEWLTDRRFATDVERVRNREVLVVAIDEVMSVATRASWLERFAAAGIPSGPINELR